MFWCPRRALGHVPRPRLALQGQTFESHPQGAQAPCSRSPKRKRPIDFHQSTFYVLVPTEGLGHVPRPRLALQGQTFESHPQGAQAPCSRSPKRKRPIDFHQSTFYVLLPTEGLGHVPRPRLALQGQTFESHPQGAQAPCSRSPKRKRPADFHQPTFYVLVPTEGLEPPHLAAHGPEPCASTNSATWA